MQDIWGEIFGHLAPIDRMSFLVAYPKFKSIIRPHLYDWSRIIKTRVAAIPVYGERLLEILKPSKMVISGGFLLQCLMGTDANTHQESDLDVYCLLDNYDQIAISPDVRKCYTFETAPDDLKRAYLMESLGLEVIDEDGEVVPYYDGASFAVTNVDIATTRELQIVYVFRENPTDCGAPAFRPESVEDYIADRFDLDFCKMTFDGERLRIFSIESLVNRRSTVTFRANKWSCAHSHCPPEQLELENMITRVVKYRKRGFTIDVVGPSVKFHDNDCRYANLEHVCGIKMSSDFVKQHRDLRLLQEELLAIRDKRRHRRFTVEHLAKQRGVPLKAITPIPYFIQEASWELPTIDQIPTECHDIQFGEPDMLRIYGAEYGLRSRLTKPIRTEKIFGAGQKLASFASLVNEVNRGDAVYCL